MFSFILFKNKLIHCVPVKSLVTQILEKAFQTFIHPPKVEATIRLFVI